MQTWRGRGRPFCRPWPGRAGKREHQLAKVFRTSFGQTISRRDGRIFILPVDQFRRCPPFYSPSPSVLIYHNNKTGCAVWPMAIYCGRGPLWKDPDTRDEDEIGSKVTLLRRWGSNVAEHAHLSRSPDTTACVISDAAVRGKFGNALPTPWLGGHSVKCRRHEFCGRKFVRFVHVAVCQ